MVIQLFLFRRTGSCILCCSGNVIGIGGFLTHSSSARIAIHRRFNRRIGEEIDRRYRWRRSWRIGWTGISHNDDNQSHKLTEFDCLNIICGKECKNNCFITKRQAIFIIEIVWRYFDDGKCSDLLPSSRSFFIHLRNDSALIQPRLDGKATRLENLMRRSDVSDRELVPVSQSSATSLRSISESKEKTQNIKVDENQVYLDDSLSYNAVNVSI